MPAVAIGQILFCKDCKNNKKKPLEKNKKNKRGFVVSLNWYKIKSVAYV